MVKRKMMLLIQIVFFLTCCKGQGQNNKSYIEGSVWEKKGTFCSDSLHFYSNGKYKEYYCEFEQHMEGKYSVNADTLILVEYNLSSELLSKKPKLEPRYVWKYLFVERGELKKVYYEDFSTREKSIGTKVSWKYVKLK